MDSANADLLHVNQQRLLVVLPLDGKLTGMRKLITGQLHRHLKAVGVQVTEVIHTCRTHTTCALKKDRQKRSKQLFQEIKM